MKRSGIAQAQRDEDYFLDEVRVAERQDAGRNQDAQSRWLHRG